MAKKKARGKKGAPREDTNVALKKAAPLASAPPSASAVAFAEFLDEFGLNRPPPAPLVNITFFLGAGFSKAWDAKYPTGCELFRVPNHERAQLLNVERAAGFSGLSPMADLTLKDVRHLVYTLDMNAKYTDIRSRYADHDSLRVASEQLRTFFGKRLEHLAGGQWHWFDDTLHRFGHSAAFTDDQNHIRDLFAKMFPLEDDGLLRFIILHFCEDEADAHGKIFFCVNTCSEKEQLERLQSVFPFAGATLTVDTYSGSFATWSGEVVSLL